MSIIDRLNLKNKRKQKVIFVYGERYKESGSTVMRTFQLSTMFRDYTNQYSVSTAPHSKNFKNSILIISKGAIQSLNTDALKRLKNNNNILLFDIVDSEVSDEKSHYFDVLICASKGSFDREVRRFGDQIVCLVDHHTDPRVYNLKNNVKDKVSIGYFGELVNTIISDRLKEKVDYIHVDTSKKGFDWFNLLKNYNVHLCVRNQDADDANKPFLKGFIAAHSGSIIIATEKQNDAVRWLGNDYPYLIKAPATEQKILKIIEQLEKDFGGKNWKKAVEICERLRQLTQNEIILEQLDTTIDQAKLENS